MKINGPTAALILGALMLVLLIAFSWSGHIRSDELIGRAPIILLKLPGQVVGLTWNHYALFFIHGRGDEFVQCQIEQVLGGPIGGYVDGGLNCLIVWTNPVKFRGWIDFRGHPRAFCGAKNDVDLPQECLWD